MGLDLPLFHLNVPIVVCERALVEIFTTESSTPTTMPIGVLAGHHLVNFGRIWTKQANLIVYLNPYWNFTQLFQITGPFFAEFWRAITNFFSVQRLCFLILFFDSFRILEAQKNCDFKNNCLRLNSQFLPLQGLLGVGMH
jgi:hypothetical protein